MYFIKCGKFFDGVNEVLKENVNILVKENYIIDVGEDVKCPLEAEVIDLRDYTVTPGLIDIHVHFDFLGTNVLTNYVFTDSDEMKTLNTIYCAEKSLKGGFTTVRTMGSAFNGYGQVDAKRAIDRKMFSGSRLIVSPHALDISGGHWDFSTFATTNPFLSECIENACVATGNGVEFCRTIVRKYVKYGADFVKIMATGGFASPIDNPDEQAFSDDEIKEIIKTAKMFNKPVVAHAYSSKLVSKLIDLGISEIEHAALIDENTMEKLVKSGIPLTPTFTPFEEIVQNDVENLEKKNKSYKQKLKKYKNQIIETRKLIIDIIKNHKMLVGYGSDIVAVYNNYDCWREFKSWRDNGISALRTLVAATSDNAKIIGRTDLGSIESGKIADIVAWKSDIINDTSAIKKCDFVMKDGTIYLYDS